MMMMMMNLLINDDRSDDLVFISMITVFAIAMIVTIITAD